MFISLDYLVTENTQSKAIGRWIFSNAARKWSARINGDVAWIKARTWISVLEERNSAAPQIDGAQSDAVTLLLRKTAAPP